MTNPCVSVVIPCLNEEVTLAACIEEARTGIEKAGITGEIIVSDNGSIDRSVEIAEELGARVVHCSRRGYGNALRSGFNAARGGWIIMADADMSYDLSDIPAFWEKISEGHDFVMGNRFKGRIETGAMPWAHRYIGNPLLSGILKVLFRTHVSDAHCGLRAFSRGALKRMELRTGGMELASEMVIKAAKARLKVAEIPVRLRKDRRNRPPHLRTFRDGWRHLRYMLMMAPGALFLAPGLVFLLGGTAAILVLLPGPLRIGNLELDVHTMLLGMALVLIGVYLLSLWAFVRAFTLTSKLSGGGLYGTMLRKFKLEHGLLLSCLLILVGFVGDLLFFLSWQKSGFGPLAIEKEIRSAIAYTTCLVVGIELLFGSFFLSMLGISRSDYVGDYTLDGEQHDGGEW